MSFTVAPAVMAALSQATAMAPRRSRTSDGTVSSATHKKNSPNSDHDPDERGMVLAFDLTDDPGRGCDAHALVHAAVARRDRRIKYAISNGRIWSAARADEGWRPYNGSNKHDKHAHVSVARRYENDTSPWWKAAAPVTDEDDMPLSDEDVKKVAHAAAELVRKDIVTLLRGSPNHPHNLTTIGANVVKLVKKLGA